MSERDPFSTSSLFERAIRGILRPLVRALIGQNVTATAFYRIVKKTYVDVAADMLGDTATDSRVSVMTGVHRRDVKEFRATTNDETEVHGRKASMLSTVIGRWLSHADYIDAEGRSLPIPRSSDQGPSFDALVQSISRDVRPRTVLDELERQGILKAHGDALHLMTDGLVGPADMDQRLHFFSRNLGDHMDAAVDNLMADAPPHMERAVFYNSLTATSVEAIEKDARGVAKDALRQINAQAAALQNDDAAAQDATHRFRFGVFFYKENERTKNEGQDSDEEQ